MNSRLGLLVGGAVVAQVAMSGVVQAAPEESSGLAVDATAATGIEEVVVTARRRNENVQNVPIAISAFSSDALRKSKIDSIADIGIVTPALNAASAGVGITPFLRGVGQPTTTPGGEGPVAMYIDGVYQPMLWTNGTPFNNVERVEVLKGPQGTLFGRNATGGLIHVITRDPSEEFSGNASVSYGNYDTVTAKAYVTGGITDGVAVDLAAYYLDSSDGWGRNFDSPQGRFGPPGKKIGLTDDLALRSKLIAQPTDRLTITVTGDYRNADTTSGYNYNIAGAVGQDGLPPVPGYYDVVVTPGRAMTMESDVWSASAKIAYDFGGFTLTSLTSYQEVEVDQTFDNDLITADLVSANTVSGINDTFQQEFQIASNGEGPFRWMAGFYYLDMEGGFGGLKGLQLTGAGLGVTAPLAIDIRNTIKTESYAVFAEVNYDFTEQTRLTVGARNTWDDRNLVGETILDGQFGGFAPIMTLATTDISKDFSDPTYRVILNHNFADEVMGYASYSHGFKSGNFNPVDPANPPFDPEELDAYEVGVKTTLLDRKVTLNGAVYYYDYSNLQFEINTGVSTQTQNATSAEIKGLELDATFVPIDNLTLRLGYAYVDGEYDEFTNAGCFTPNPIFDPNVPGSTVNNATVCDASGTPIIRTPENSYNASVNYSVPLASSRLDLNLAYQTSSEVRYDLQGRLRQDSVDLMNGSIYWTADSGLRIGAFGKNLLDEEYSSYYIEQAFGDYYAASPPRTYGFEIGYDF